MLPRHAELQLNIGHCTRRLLEDSFDNCNTEYLSQQNAPNAGSISLTEQLTKCAPISLTEQLTKCAPISLNEQLTKCAPISLTEQFTKCAPIPLTEHLRKMCPDLAH